MNTDGGWMPGGKCLGLPIVKKIIYANDSNFVLVK